MHSQSQKEQYKHIQEQYNELKKANQELQDKLHQNARLLESEKTKNFSLPLNIL